MPPRESAATDAAQAIPVSAPRQGAALPTHFEEDPDDPYSQFAVFDDAELIYDTDEPIAEVDTNVDYDRVAVPRYVLYVQGAMLGVVGLFCFALGMMAGGALFTRSEPATPQPVTLSGSISYARGTRDAADVSAVIVALPQTEQLDERAPIGGLRPDDPPPEATHRGLEIIRTIGGAYARADERGEFQLELPMSGRYFVLVISANTNRRSSQPPATEDLLKMGRYFENAADLLGSNRYQWTSETLRSDRRLNVVFD